MVFSKLLETFEQGDFYYVVQTKSNQTIQNMLFYCFTVTSSSGKECMQIKDEADLPENENFSAKNEQISDVYMISFSLFY